MASIAAHHMFPYQLPYYIGYCSIIENIKGPTANNWDRNHTSWCWVINDRQLLWSCDLLILRHPAGWCVTHSTPSTLSLLSSVQLAYHTYTKGLRHIGTQTTPRYMPAGAVPTSHQAPESAVQDQYKERREIRCYIPRLVWLVTPTDNHI